MNKLADKDNYILLAVLLEGGINPANYQDFVAWFEGVEDDVFNTAEELRLLDWKSLPAEVQVLVKLTPLSFPSIRYIYDLVRDREPLVLYGLLRAFVDKVNVLGSFASKHSYTKLALVKTTFQLFDQICAVTFPAWIDDNQLL